MRATKNHFGSDNHRYERQTAVKPAKPAKARKGVKAASLTCAGLIACAALIIPTTTLAPNVDAYEDSRAASFSIGGLDQFSAAISNNCAEVTAPETEAVTAAAKDKTSAGKQTSEAQGDKNAAVASEGKETSQTPEQGGSASSAAKSGSDNSGKATAKTGSAQSSASGESSSASSSSSSSSASSSAEVSADNDDNGYDYDDGVYAADDDTPSYSGSYLVDIDYPDYSYSPSRVSLSSYDRAKLERLVMGEAGSMGYLGCALVAQSIRDAMNRSNTTSIDQIISQYQYFGSTAIEPNSDVRNAVSFIFDENGSAIQHRVICFYTGTSSWHETQTFLIQVDNVRFFDLNA